MNIPTDRSCANLNIKAPITATIILPPRVELRNEVNINDPK